MNAFETFILGVVQGLTEFLPISSSGHLVLFQNLFGFTEPELLLDAALHFGTLVAVCVHFRSDLKQMALDTLNTLAHPGDLRPKTQRPHFALFLAVLAGSVPTAAIGILFRKPLTGLFGSVDAVGIALLATGGIVALTRLVPQERGTRDRVGFLIAFAVGAAQGLAIVPGISRSGTTIACGLLLGLERQLAGRFSFLLSIPAISGALALELTSPDFQRIGFLPLIIGFIFSGVTGLLALRLLMGMIRKGHLYYFAPYCWALGLFVLTYL